MRRALTNTQSNRSSSLTARSSTCGTSAESQIRTFFCFTCQSPALIEAQEKKGFESDFWVGASTALRQKCELKRGEKPVRANQLPKAVELYNLDDMVIAKEQAFRLGHPAQHSSVTNKRTYQADFQLHLADRAQQHGFKSKWWIGRWSAWKEGGEFAPVPNPRLCRVLVNWTEPMVNMSQLKDGGQIFTNLCYDAGMAEHFNAEANRNIYMHAKTLASQMSRPQCFYSIRQCEKLGLKIDDSKAFIFNNLVSDNMSNSSPNWIYNWSEFEGAKDPGFIKRKLPESLHQQAIEGIYTPTGSFAFTGNEMKARHIYDRIDALQKKAELSVNIWVFEYEIKKHNLKLTDGRRPYNVENRVNAIKQADKQATTAEKTSMFLPLEHLQDPLLGKKKFGTVVL